MRLNLMRGDEVLFRVIPNSTTKLPDGSYISPTMDGWSRGEYRIVQVQEPEVVPPTAAEALVIERDGMSCTPIQGILALGEENWNTIQGYRDRRAPNGNPMTPWAERVVIDKAQTWKRNSTRIAGFQTILQFTDAQVDDLFRTAMLIDA